MIIVITFNHLLKICRENDPIEIGYPSTIILSVEEVALSCLSYHFGNGFFSAFPASGENMIFSLALNGAELWDSGFMFIHFRVPKNNELS